MDLTFEEHGEGKPIFLLHAFPLSRAMWQPQIATLKSERLRIIAPDLRGFGETHNFSDINTMEDMARDVAELFGALNIERAIVIGLSMGGYVTFELLKNFPEKIAGLVLCDTHAGADSDETHESRFNLIEKIEKEGAQALIDDLLPKLICENTKQNKKELVEKIAEMFRSANPKAVIAALRGMAKRADNNALLDQISVPTLLIFGAEDKITNLEMAEKMRNKIPDSQLSVIENAGHFSNLEQPEVCNSRLIDFINTVEI
jgi:pimeloyl-ACP methyl ester carboxylesterase